ncbi:MAG: succinate dehydrogenase assembly factor 2 [Bdellovibrionales bacterium]
MKNDPNDRRRERLRFRSWHRGTRELDTLLGRFADAHLAEFSPQELDAYEDLLLCGDPDLFDWITKKTPVPAERDSEVLRNLIAFFDCKPYKESGG